VAPMEGGRGRGGESRSGGARRAIGIVETAMRAILPPRACVCAAAALQVLFFLLI
jgi:hypothetical protein